MDETRNRVHDVAMTKRLQATGNRGGKVLDRPVSDLLGMAAKSGVKGKTDSKRVTIPPVNRDDEHRKRLAKIKARVSLSQATPSRNPAKYTPGPPGRRFSRTLTMRR